MSSSATDDLKRYKKGNVLFTEGEPSTFLYIIKSGKVLLVREQGDGLVPLSVVGAGQFIGEISIFTDEPRSASAIIQEDAQLYLIKKSDIKNIVKTCPEWISDIIETLCMRLKHTTDVLKEHKLMADGSQTNLTTEQEKTLRQAILDHRAGRGMSH